MAKIGVPMTSDVTDAIPLGNSGWSLQGSKYIDPQGKSYTTSAFTHLQTHGE
ncbi:MAG: hypothetical protein MJZ69_02030 [Bacteroidaceae bacterium]|nr:hypothetical protein [Candidatus Minthousia equi]MCQ2245549.1 hypothetical protein [Bacteroidaceae bacterium]MDO4955442.1 hypothetical protein [Bacteroidales bacterium]